MEAGMPVASRRVVTVAKQRFELQRDEVEASMQGVMPEAITSHYVVVAGQRYPPKQVIGELTSIDRADFTTHQARRILMGLGFVVGRQPRQVVIDEPAQPEERAVGGGDGPDQGRSVGEMVVRPEAIVLQPFIGMWVATRGADVLFADPDPGKVVGWLAANRQRAESMFRVPGSEFEAGGAAPL
jgi:hypothetical protein